MYYGYIRVSSDVDRTYMITTIRHHERFEIENENFAQKNERSFGAKRL